MSNRTLTKIEQRQREYYNRIAQVYDEHYSNKYALRYRQMVYDQLLKGVEIESRKVLDAMCGGGENTGYLLDKKAEVTGLDISEHQCQIYQDRFPNCNVICSSIIQTNLPDNTFDIVVTESLHHLHPYLDEGMSEIHRILKPNGYLMIWEPSAGSIFDMLRKIWYKLDREYFEDNEQSIDLKRLSHTHPDKFELMRSIFGGNLAHLLVQESMLFRIPPKLVNFYAPILLSMDRFIQLFQNKWTACWVAALFRSH